VLKSLTPGQALIKVVRDELTAVMGSAASDLNLNVPAPAIILMAGLQGAGKTTTVGKLAKHLKEKRKKKVMVVSADVYRPAAIEQLKTLADQVGVLFFPSTADQKPEAIVRAAIDDARKSFVDVLIVDTAGRLAIDEAMMAEIKALHAAVNPAETLFVVDAMTGQDAANTAKAFGDALPLTGVVLTKTDGDARGGAALSVRYITGKPIKFVGVSEKPDGLDVFHPDRIASRILDMGDVLSLVEQVEQQVDKDKAQKLAEKVAKGKKFDLNDMRRAPQGAGQPRQGSAADDRDHQLDDQEGAPQPGPAQRLAPRPYRARFRADPGRRQQAHEAVPADGKDDEQDGRRRHEGHDAQHEGDDGRHGRPRRHAVPLSPARVHSGQGRCGVCWHRLLPQVRRA